MAEVDSVAVDLVGSTVVASLGVDVAAGQDVVVFIKATMTMREGKYLKVRACRLGDVEEAADVAGVGVDVVHVATSAATMVALDLNMEK